MKKYPDGEVKYFFLLSGDVNGEAASMKAVEKWDAKYDFGPHGITLRDDKQKGFKAFFPDSKGKDGTVVLSKGFKVQVPFTKLLDASQIEDALKAK